MEVINVGAKKEFTEEIPYDEFLRITDLQKNR